jgi:energy-coupling factor transport system substrate-specific component
MKNIGVDRLTRLAVSASLFVTVPLPICLAFAGLGSALKEWGALSTMAIGITILGVAADAGKIADTRRIALVSTLGATSAALRLPLTVIPNVQPCTFLIMCSGIALGSTSGFLVGVLTPLISNLFLGHGPWTLFQAYAWGIVGFISGMMRFNHNTSIVRLSVLGASFGYLYGLVMNVWFWQSFMYPHTPVTLMMAELQGLYFDTLHALGNLIFLSVLGKRTLRLFSSLAGYAGVG